VAERGPRLVSVLARRYRDIELAEDAVQEAWLRALARWPSEGVPKDPVAWVFTVARNQVRDALRRREEPVDAVPEPALAEAHRDDRLALLFACCHPDLAPRDQVGLALRSLCGLSTDEVARAFLEHRATTARRLSRASQRIRDRGIPIEVPPADERPARTAAVLASIYLVFNEGYASTHAERTVRPEVCEDALRLGHAAADLLDEPEAAGLVALMTLHHARRDGRVDPHGEPVALDAQDRRLWRADEIGDGLGQLDAALRRGRPGPYQIQAAIAALHARAPTAEDTDWTQITALYGALLQHQPSPVVELNAAVALAMSHGAQRGLDWLDDLDRRGVLRGFHLLPAARADLLRRLGRHADADRAYADALALVRSPAEQRFLERRRNAQRHPTRRRRTPSEAVRRVHLTDREWRRVAALFPVQRGRGRPRRPDREVLEAVLWVLGTGAPWRDLPASHGPWQTAYHRFRVWENDGTLARVAARLGRHAGAVGIRALRGTRADSL
jgi:RNA polymerase sigma-70 factor (ECF subfamily)